jgi:hypothetical protein
VYHISVENPDHVDGGIAAVMVDGRDLLIARGTRGICLPGFRSGTEHEVRIVMGR